MTIGAMNQGDSGSRHFSKIMFRNQERICGKMIENCMTLTVKSTLYCAETMVKIEKKILVNIINNYFS